MATISHDSETPTNKEQVITACAFIHQIVDGELRVFMAQRAKTKKFLPGMYELPGGHIDFGEEVVDGLKREIREELGMDVSVGDPFHTFTYINKIKGSHSLEIEYFAKFARPISDLRLQPEDHSEWRWISEAEASDLLMMTNEERGAILHGFKIIKSGKLNLG